VIDTETNEVIDTISTGAAGRAVASVVDVNGDGVPDRQHVYVAGQWAVSTIDADPMSATYNQVIATIDVPTSCSECYNGVWDVAVSPDGNRLYAGQGDGTISVFNVTDPRNPVYLSTASVGLWDGDMEVTSDGRRLYVAHISSDDVEVLDSTTLATVARIHVGPTWDLDSTSSETTDNTYNLAISPDGTRAYVTQRVLVVQRGVGGQTSGWFVSDSRGQNWLVTDTYSAVSVIDLNPASGTYNREIARMTVPDGAHDIAVSPDGSRAYVTHLDSKSVTVIDTESNAVLGTFTTDQTGGVGYNHRTVAVGSDGTLYITDFADNTLYASTVSDGTIV
jgi:YVTN family beta-propeller protein